MVFTKFAPLVALAAVAATQVSAMPRVDSSVHRALREQATVNIVVTMKTGVDSAISSVHEADFNTRGQKIAALVTTLEVNAKSSQSSVDKLLSQEASNLFASEQVFWITNQRIIKGATIELVEKLAGVPEIAEIREEVIIPAPVFNAPTNSTVGRVGLLANEWGITKVDAPSVWATGNRGEGIVVGSLDTGVRATHTSLAANFRKDYNWFDGVANKTTPYDDIGHGTHTIGTMVGLNGIGMAPAAQFISCNAFTADGGEESWLLRCAEFLTCPTTPDGKNKDCSKAPHVINNSWGGGRGDKFFAGAISAWRAAGIIPVFANGNEGAKAPFCNTANSPADDPNVIAVGATDKTDKLGSFSSKGPTAFNTIKPELSAPGVDVRSAWGTGNTAFNTIPGTSMAAPHVSGTVALMLSKNPKLTFDQVRQALISTTETALKASGRTCGGTADTTFPNNQYGYGRLNAFRAVSAV